MQHLHILLLGMECDYARDRYEPYFAGQGHRNIEADTKVRVLLQEVSEAHARDASRMLQRPEQSLAPHGLQQIIDGVSFESRYRILIVGRRKNNRRRHIEATQVISNFDAVHGRHANIQQHDVGFEGLA